MTGLTVAVVVLVLWNLYQGYRIRKLERTGTGTYQGLYDEERLG